jgi:adenine-specific DNA-methyltransferase
LPRVKEINWDEEAGQLVIPFEYRPLTEQEAITYGKKNQKEKIIEEALKEIPKRLSPKKAAQALAALTAERHKTADGKSVSFLEHHLRQYTRQNTSDFFIHKDLKGFLTRELDFYLKNEVLNLDEIEAAGEERAEAWFQLMRVIKAIGGRIVEFLAQIEDFQKMLWEKRKFITETQYCITVGNIDESFYPDIAACEAQWAEWKELFHIDEEETNLFTSGKSKKDKRIAFLKAHPTLVLDTKHFDQGFVDRLLASFDDLDELTDGLLVHSENWQALNLLVEKYRRKAQCIYIDPPFNTGGDFLYNDMFRNSTWLALLTNRIESSLPLLSENGNYFVHLDYNAMHYAKILLLRCFSDLNELIFNTNATKDEESGLFSYKSFALKFVRQHDTILHAFNAGNRFVKLWKPNRNTSELDLGQLDILSAPKQQNPKSLADFRFYIECYHNSKLIQKDINIEEKIFPIGDVWNDIYSFTQSEMRTSENVSFPTQKPENLLRRIIQASTVPGDIVVDFFAGSGTTAVVAHKLRRQYIAVEIGDYFEDMYDDYDSATGRWVKKLGVLGRMKNVLHGDERFDACGKSRRSTLSKQIRWKGGGAFKYIRLESYEDTLNNIEFDDASGQRALELFKDEYLLQYMLKWETRKSETLLNVEKLARPFSYKLHIHTDGQTREKVVDIPETFSYLLGLHVKTRQVLHDGDRRYLVYRGRIDHREVVIIWRENEDWTKEDLERDKKFVAEQKLSEGADEVFVNGDSFIRGAKALELVFKARMFAPVEA